MASQNGVLWFIHTERGQGQVQGLGTISLNILYRNVHTGSRQEKEPGSIPCTFPIPVDTQRAACPNPQGWCERKACNATSIFFTQCFQWPSKLFLCWYFITATSLHCGLMISLCFNIQILQPSLYFCKINASLSQFPLTHIGSITKVLFTQYPKGTRFET